MYSKSMLYRFLDDTVADEGARETARERLEELKGRPYRDELGTVEDMMFDRGTVHAAWREIAGVDIENLRANYVQWFGSTEYAATEDAFGDGAM